MTTLDSCWKTIRNRFAESPIAYGHGSEDAADEAWWLICHVCDLDFSAAAKDSNYKIPTSHLKTIQSICEQRIQKRKPLAYLLQQAWFCGMPFYVDERVIIPRSYIGEWLNDDLQTWVEADQVKSVIDLCTGCGCIAIVASMLFPQARIHATDISLEALEVARINLERHQCQHITLHHGDLLGGMPNSINNDLILCNPPYVDSDRADSLPAESHHEPAQALFADNQGLEFIQRILQQARHALSPEGYLLLEAGSAISALEDAYPHHPFMRLASADGQALLVLLQGQELQELLGN